MPIQRSEHDGENCRYVNTKILHSITWPHYTNSPVLVLFQEFHILENSGKNSIIRQEAYGNPSTFLPSVLWC